MKISKRRLKRIIKETIKETRRDLTMGDAGWYDEKHETLADRKFADSQQDDHDRKEYDRGYQDGFDEVAPDSGATASYDVGYEDGAHDASMDDDKDYERWFKS